MKKLVILTFVAGLTIGLATPTNAFEPEALWQAWPEERFVTTAAPCLRFAELGELLSDLADQHPEALEVEEVGRSFENRPIYMLTLGTGDRKVLLWSQMHGDEPAATPALLDLVDYLLRHASEPVPSAILEDLTLLIVPMLNPDGSEIYERRNAQGIDINRDALNLVTPEGRLLKRLRDEHEPMLGFNLHDQNRRTAVGDTGKLATNAVLAVAGDAEGTVTPGRLLAKRACAAIVEALAPFMPGGMARYDEDWSPRAFGDNITAWGTPVVLIESGGLPPGKDFSELTRLNFVALLKVLAELVDNNLAGYATQIYEDLKRNQGNSWVDVMVRGGSILQPGTAKTYRSDLPFNVSRDDRFEAGCDVASPRGSRIFDIGDGRFLAAGREIDAAGQLLMAPFTVAVEGWKARRWLDAEALERLTALGVGEVQWQVPVRRLDAARRQAESLNRAGVAQLLPVAEPSRFLKLEGVPEIAEASSFAEIVRALGSSGEDFRSLEALWQKPRQSARPVLRRGSPASFLMVGGVEGDDFENATLEAVWLDGVEVRGVKQ